MTPQRPDDTFRERFLDSSDRFQVAMLTAIKAHQEGVAIFLETHEHLQESIDELKALVLDQGGEIRALRALLDGR